MKQTAPEWYQAINTPNTADLYRVMDQAVEDFMTFFPPKAVDIDVLENAYTMGLQKVVEKKAEAHGQELSQYDALFRMLNDVMAFYMASQGDPPYSGVPYSVVRRVLTSLLQKLGPPELDESEEAVASLVIQGKTERVNLRGVLIGDIPVCVKCATLDELEHICPVCATEDNRKETATPAAFILEKDITTPPVCARCHKQMTTTIVFAPEFGKLFVPRAFYYSDDGPNPVIN